MTLQTQIWIKIILIKTFLVQTTILRLCTKPGIYEIFEVLYLAEIGYSELGVFNKMTHKTSMWRKKTR